MVGRKPLRIILKEKLIYAWREKKQVRHDENKIIMDRQLTESEI